MRAVDSLNVSGALSDSGEMLPPSWTADNASRLHPARIAAPPGDLWRTTETIALLMLIFGLVTSLVALVLFVLR